MPDTRNPNDPKLPTPIRNVVAGQIPGPESGVPPPPPSGKPGRDILVPPPVPSPQAGPNPTGSVIVPTPDFRYYEGWKDDDGNWHTTQLPVDDREHTGPDGKIIKIPGLRSWLKRQIAEEVAKRIAEFATHDQQIALAVTLADLRNKPNLTPAEQARLSDANKLLAKLTALREFADRQNRMIDTFTFEQVVNWKMPHQWPKPT